MTLNDDLQRIEEETWKRQSKVYDSLTNTPPKTLYHYTDVSGVEGILRSGEIWATHADYLNDPNEVVHGQEMFRRLISKARREATEEDVRRFYEKCAENLDKDLFLTDPKSEYYCASFSARGDDLSQYRAYSAQGSGYCIGFDAEELMRNAGQIPYAGGSLFELVRVEYDETVQKRFLEEEMGTMEKYALRLLTEHPEDTEKILHRLSLLMVQTAMLFSQFWKKPGFRDEKEWRIITDPFGGTGAKPIDPYLDVRRSPSGLLVPYLQIRIADKDKGHTALREIHVGPRLPFKKAESGLRRLLYSLKSPLVNSSQHVEIRPSATALQ